MKKLTVPGLGPVSFVVTVALLLGLFFMPSPYVTNRPGATVDTLGVLGDEPIVDVGQEQAGETSGQLLLTTVQVTGMPGRYELPATTVGAWLLPSRSVLPIEAVYGDLTSSEELEEINAAQMTQSQDTALIAAFNALGADLTEQIFVAQTSPEYPASKVLQPEDLLLEVQGVPVDSYAGLRGVLSSAEVGTVLDVLIERDGIEHLVHVETVENPEGGVLMGIGVAVTADLPEDMSIHLANITGPSAGLIFALAAMMKMEDPDRIGDAVVAGTGTISTDGLVGAIGGIQQKLVAARRDGASVFLAPVANCAEVVGAIPEGLQVVAVDTLDSAWQALEAIGEGESTSLPGCSLDLTDGGSATGRE